MVDFEPAFLDTLKNMHQNQLDFLQDPYSPVEAFPIDVWSHHADAKIYYKLLNQIKAYQAEYDASPTKFSHYKKLDND